MTPTVPASKSDLAPVRPGTIGLPAPAAPLDFLICELERASGHELTLKSIGDGFILWDEVAQDAMSEGATRAECVANAFECYWPGMAPLKVTFDADWGTP